MKTLVICPDPPEVRGNFKMMQLLIVENLDIIEEDQPMALPFHKLNCCNMVIDPIMIIYLLKVILGLSAVEQRLIFCIYGLHGWNSSKNYMRMII